MGHLYALANKFKEEFFMDFKLFTAEEARQLYMEADVDIQKSIEDRFQKEVWDNDSIDGELVNILYDIVLVARTQFTRIAREMTISEENIEELERLGYEVSIGDDNYYYVSF